MIVFPNCKINLGLHIIRKRSDGYHDLETVFYPLSLQDALEIVPQQPGMETVLNISGSSLAIPAQENICLKAWQLLKKDFSRLPEVRIHLHKVIPSGAGLGGGSSDGAFTLLLLNRKFSLGLEEKELIRYALLLGSDCPFFVVNRPSLAQGRGEILEHCTIDLSPYTVIVINPGIHIATGWAFSQLKPLSHRRSMSGIISQPIQQWRQDLVNDFEEVVFPVHDEVRQLKETLYEKGAIYASMSGSGSSVYGIFPKNALPEFSFPSHYYIRRI